MTPTLIYSHGAVVFPPHLACLIGLNEAIVFQRIVWLCGESNYGKLDEAGRRWIFNTPRGWRYWFPFFSAHTIRRALENLRAMHLLDCEQKEGPSAPFFYSPAASAEVVLRRLEEAIGLANLPNGVPKLDTPLAQIGHAPLAQIGQQTEISLYRDITIHGREPAGFEDFWKAYPKRQAKGQARKAWINRKCSTLLPQILAAVEKAKASEQWRKDGGQFIPYPASWLNAERWEDEIAPPPDRMFTPRKPESMFAFKP